MPATPNPDLLPRDVPMISKYRQQHGDITGRVDAGRITAAWAVDTSLAAQMVSTGKLSAYHIGCGLDYIELRNALYGALQVRTSAFMYSLGDCSLKRKDALEIYEAIREGVGGGNEKILVIALDPLSTDPKFSLSLTNLNQIQHVFNLLVETTECVLHEFKEKRHYHV